MKTAERVIVISICVSFVLGVFVGGKLKEADNAEMEKLEERIVLDTEVIVNLSKVIETLIDDDTLTITSDDDIMFEYEPPMFPGYITNVPISIGDYTLTVTTDATIITPI